ncbi:phosphatidylinositol phosphate synthase [Allobranchiibius huperziae]|uniref:Phosphatidylinositol phosphate synthase n=1 Tax=Allobranchiibius huperziae TaxID=1874116 RepID=A0A853DIG9_9MICO|nr:CDP-alcohol phosphatidyltransferase family protein [Allobranchiibius huperziae]NYJ74824.1 CDP-diacylglycerol--glycerol-3-phosphate 3-phosphatidyltransferase [Allobranchiibius huperziae]
MLNRFARAFFTTLLTPTARFFIKCGISPDAITIVGTLGVVVGALVFYPIGQFFWGTLFITAFVFSDLIDGNMARQLGRSSNWGAYLDSTLDRFGDAAIFGGLVLYYADRGDNVLIATLALACLILGSVVSYAKARAEGLGMTANVGIAERADRLVSILVITGLVGIGNLIKDGNAIGNWVEGITLAVLAVLSFVTVLQRMLTVRTQALSAQTPPAAAARPTGESSTPRVE